MLVIGKFGPERATHKSLATLMTALVIITAGLTLSNSARGEDEHFGLTEYEIACIGCHGINGRGDGPQAQSLRVRPADLTQIAKRNGGIFPYKKVEQMIDGRADIAAHSTREMPVWGDRYRIVVEPDESQGAVEQRARERIDALVRYVESLQED